MTIIPPSAVPPSATAPGAPTAPSGQPGAVLTRLPAAQPATPGTVITGTVVGRDNQGQMLLQTDAGMVAFKTAAALTVGSQVSLQIQAVGSQLQAVILSALAAGPKTPAAPTTGRSATAPGTTTAAPATTIATSVTTGSVLTGTVIGPSGGPVPPQAHSGNAPNAALQGALPAAGRATAGGATPVSNPGSTSASGPAGAASLPSSGSPAATPAALVAQQSATPSSAGVSTAAARYAATPGNAASGTTPSQPLPTPPTSAATSSTPVNPQPLQPAAAGTAVQVRLASTLPGASTPAGSTPVTATLVAHTANGQTLIDTPIGRLTVTLPAGAGHQPPGSTIALEIVSVGGGTSAATAMSLAGNAARSLPTLGQDWPTLKAAISALTGIDPSFARQIVEVALPRLGTPRFLSQLLGLIITGGSPADSRTLLGDTAHALLERAGRGDVLARLDAELRDMNRLNSTSSDWRVIFLPLADMSELRQLRVYTRKKKGGKGSKDRSGRFIVEAEFEAYGPLQLDGLVQKPRIDLIVRSHVEFPPSMQAGIADVFGRTCDASGLIGKIFFHASPQFPVSPLDEIAQAGPGLSV